MRSSPSPPTQPHQARPGASGDPAVRPGVPLDATGDDSATDSQRLDQADQVAVEEAERQFRPGRERKDALAELLDVAGPDGRIDIAAINHQRAQLRELAALRKELHVSRSVVARRMQTSNAAVARLEAGEVDVRLSTLGRYARALGCRLTWALTPFRSR